jgi:AcrR family transcriptional regulator
MMSAVPAPSATHTGRPRSSEADQAILDATVELMAEHGYAGLTMAAVIAKSGVSSATLYRRYADKDELVMAALECMKDGAYHLDTGSLEGDIRSLLLAVARDMHGSTGRLMVTMLGDFYMHPQFGALVRKRMIESKRKDLEAMFVRAVDRGEIAEVPDPQIASELLVGPLVHRMLLGGTPPTPAFVDRLLPYLLHAVGGRRESD